MAKILISTAAKNDDAQPMPAKDWFLQENYVEVKRLAKFVLDSNPDTTPRAAARDLLDGKYTTQKEINADLKLVSDHAVLIVRGIAKKAKNN
ncbi:MAG: hypothetical protein ABWX90_03605 [Candidatus Saccharimonadales bacterium]